LLALHSGPQAKGNFTNPQHNDPDEIAFWKKENETDSFLQSVVSACVRTNGANLRYVGTAATVRDMLSLSEVIDGKGKPVNYWGVRYVWTLRALVCDDYDVLNTMVTF
jgi:hypothetical protein